MFPANAPAVEPLRLTPAAGYRVTHRETWRIDSDGKRTLVAEDDTIEPATDRETAERALRAEIAALREEAAKANGRNECLKMALSVIRDRAEAEL